MRRWAGASAVGAGVLLLVAATAWACVSGPAVNLSTTTAKPGDQITVSGTGFRQPHPVDVRFNALDGPILATFDAPGSDRTVEGQVTIPEGTRPGNYVLILSQNRPDGSLSQLPIRALVSVVGPTGETPVVGQSVSTPIERPTGLVEADNDISGATLAMITLGVAGVGMFAAGMAALVAGRRRTAEPEVARVRS